MGRILSLQYHLARKAAGQVVDHTTGSGLKWKNPLKPVVCSQTVKKYLFTIDKFLGMQWGSILMSAEAQGKQVMLYDQGVCSSLRLVFVGVKIVSEHKEWACSDPGFNVKITMLAISVVTGK